MRAPRLLVALSLTLSASTLAGQLRPASGPGDPRLQTVAYDANQVVQLQVAIGYQLTVEFAPDERVENAAVGDSSAWQVSANNRGDRLFIKLSSGGAPTNLTVMTDARTYVFELVPAEGGTSAPYMVRFVYPDGRTDPVSATGTPGAGELSSYELRGAKRLWPSAMGDDNVRTFIEWPADRALPAVFAIDDTGQEVTVDGHMRDGRYVIDTVRPKLIFRMDREVATAERILPRVRK